MVNDTVIAFSIMTFFVLLGGIIPFAQDIAGDTQINNNPDAFMDNITSQVKTVSPTSAWGVFSSILTMFFWTFGTLPFIIDLAIFIPLRLTLAWLFIRIIRGQ